MTSGAQINGYGIIVSNNKYGIVGTASIRFNNAVNLSAYMYLKCKVIKRNLTTATVSYILGVSTGMAATTYMRSTSLSADEGTLILDVSDLTGTYFICFEVSGNVNVVSSSGSCIAHITEAILSNS